MLGIAFYRLYEVGHEIVPLFQIHVDPRPALFRLVDHTDQAVLHIDVRGGDDDDDQHHDDGNDDTDDGGRTQTTQKVSCFHDFLPRITY